MLVSNTLRFCTDIFGFIEEVEEETQEDPTPVDPATDEPGTEDPPEEPETITKPTTVDAPTYKKALLISKTPINCSNKTAVSKIIISGSEPSKSKRRFMWKIGSNFYKFVSGSLVEYTDDITVDNVLKKGNAATGVNNLTDITDFVGKKIYPVIALRAPADATEYPTAKIQVKATNTTETLTDVQETPEYNLTDSDAVPRIVAITADTSTTGNGSVDIKVKVKDADENWSDWLTIQNAADREAAAVQFQFTYNVTTPDGSDSAQVNEVVVEHTQGKTVVSGDDAHLYSTVINYQVPLQLCYCTVRHSELIDSTIDVYVNYMRAPARRELIQLGTASGARQEVVLGLNQVPDLNIDVSSIVLYADDEIFTAFDANSASGTVVLTAPQGKVIYASYDYNHDVELWRKMTKVATEPYTDDGETFVSRYEYELPDSDATDKVISNVRLVLKRPTGKVTSYTLNRNAKRKKNLFTLPHLAKRKTIKFTSADVEFDYDEQSGILFTVSPKNTPLVCSFSWEGEPIEIYGFSAGWSLA